MQEPDLVETCFELATVQMNLAALAVKALHEKGVITASEAREIVARSIGRCEDPNPVTRLICAELLDEFPE